MTADKMQKAFVIAHILFYLEKLLGVIAGLGMWDIATIKKLFNKDPEELIRNVIEYEKDLMRKLYNVMKDVGTKDYSIDKERYEMLEACRMVTWEPLSSEKEAICEYEKERGKRGVKYIVELWYDKDKHKYILVLKKYYAVKYHPEDGSPIFMDQLLDPDEMYFLVIP